MKTIIKLLAICYLPSAIGFSVHAQGTAFTYQGRLNDGANPATGSYDLRYVVCDAVTNGSAVSSVLTNATTPVTNGLFTVTLDFGAGVFTGVERWLDIAVRTNGGAAFIPLAPRQPLTPTPYAIFAGTASGLSGTLPASQMSGIIPLAQLPGAVVTNGASGVNLTGTLSGNATTATTANNLSGSLSGDVTGTQSATVVSTVGGQSAANVASGTAAANVASSAPGPDTIVKRDASGAFSAGNITADSFSGFGANLTGVNAARLNGLWEGYFWQMGGNDVSSEWFLGSTNNQRVDIRVNNTRVLRLEPSIGGVPNIIGGGAGNTVGGSHQGSVIAGGGAYGSGANSIQSDFSVIGGGYLNLIEGGAPDSTIGGGVGNTIQTSSDESTIAGGYYNTIETNGHSSVIGGGRMNKAAVGAWFGTVPGGFQNVVGGQGSFAAGQYAQALHQASFVWSDGTLAWHDGLYDSIFASTAERQFLIRATGGVGINTNNPHGAALNVNGVISATSFVGDGAGLVNLTPALAHTAWLLGGNAGTTPETDYLGTTDN